MPLHGRSVSILALTFVSGQIDAKKAYKAAACRQYKTFK
jgi:hypothetical protein